MKVVIGRDPASGSLKVCVDGGRMQTVKGTQGVSPMVAKDHLMLESQDGQNFIITNLQDNNLTYVGGVPVMRYRIRRGDNIFIGADRQPLDWRALDAYIPRFVSITHLKDIWEGYQNKLLQLQIDQQKAGTKRMLTPVFSILGSVLGGAVAQIVDVDGIMRVLITALFMLPGLICMIYFFIKGNKEAEFFPRERKRQEKLFKQAYVCPQCGQPFGMVDYSILSTRPGCTNCKSKFLT